MITRLIIAGFGLIPLAGWSATAEIADLVFLGGHIVTADAQGTTAQALALRDGRILAVGSTEQIRRRVGRSTEVIELGGKTVLPGLHESHVHAVACSLASLRDPYQELSSIAEIQDWVRRRAREVPAGEWIRIPRNEITRLKERRHPTVQELDAATTAHPVVFEAVRKYVFNTRGWSELGVAGERVTLPNATLIPGKDGRPQFLVADAGARTYASRFAARDTATEDQKRDALLTLHRAYNAVGITTICERGSPIADYRVYEKLKEAGRLTVRTRFALRYPYRTGAELERFMQETNARPGMGDDWLSLRTLKITADGGIHWGNTRLSEPYGQRRAAAYVHSDPDYRGEFHYTEEELTSMFDAAARVGWQMVVHVTGDAGTDTVLRAMEHVSARNPLKEKRFSLTHSYFPTATLARRAAALGVCVDTQTYTYYKDAEFIADIYGQDWARRFIGVGTWREAGVPVAINSDHMVGYDPDHSMNSYNPFLALHIAVNRLSESGNVHAAEQKLSRLDALRAVTAVPAYLNFEEAKSGTLEPGKYADLVVIDRNYLTCPEEEIRRIKVLRTVVAGRTVYEPTSSASAR